MKPILFNTEMVRKIVDGTKTVTRRVVPERVLEKYYDYDEWCNAVMSSDIPCQRYYEKDAFMQNTPYLTGDILYVREAFGRHPSGKYCYRADYIGAFGWGWHPSIHMPKEAARIFLRATGVRAERLQDITDEQALAEGATGVPCNHPDISLAGGTICCVDCMNTGWLEPPKVNFAEIWDSTIKRKDREKYGWDANPWVFVIEFERISKEEAAKSG